jgi:hypothetical protein
MRPKITTSQIGPCLTSPVAKGRFFVRDISGSVSCS